MTRRREFVKAGAALALLAGRGEVPAFAEAPPPAVPDRLDQGPFGIEQDEGWYTIEATTAAAGPVRNFGTGLVGYTWEENGPALEDGYHRHYRTDTERFKVDAATVSVIDKTMLHALDVGANYWSLWTEAENLARYQERYPAGFAALRQRLGYRVRPSWVWQRKRQGTSELMVAFANDGVAGVPGALRVFAETPDGKVKVGGSLDAGHPHGGRLRLASFLLPPGREGRTVRLRAELETRGVRRPVRWACAQPLDGDGALPVQLKRHEDADWRKGI